MAALQKVNKISIKWPKRKGDINLNEEYNVVLCASAEADYQLSVCWDIERTIERRIAKDSNACPVCRDGARSRYEIRQAV